MNELLKGTDAVEADLRKFGINSAIKVFTETTRTAEDAAKAINCEVAQIVKSLIFKTANSNKPVLILVSGPNRVNEKIIEEHLNEPLVKADANFVRDVTGFAIGGVSPVGHKTKIELIFIDEDLLKFNDIWAAAGTPNSVFNINSQDLLKVTAGQKIQLSR